MKKKNIILAGIFLSMFITVCFVFFRTGKMENDRKNEERFIDSGFYGEKKEIENFFSSRNIFKKSNQEIQIGITSHHLPDAFPILSDFWKNFYISDGPRSVFFILGPDHFERCNSIFSISSLDYKTPFGILQTDKEIVKKFQEKGVVLNNNCFEGEHSIAVQVLFIKYLYPQSRIVPIIFSSRASGKLTENLTDLIFSYKDRASVILSVDFSHFNSFDEASKIDSETLELIKKGINQDYKLKMVDSPGALETVINLSNKFGKKEFKLLRLGNSFEFSGNRNSTTGYISGYFK